MEYELELVQESKNDRSPSLSCGEVLFLGPERSLQKNLVVMLANIVSILQVLTHY